MKRPASRSFRWPDAAILLAFAVMAVVVVVCYDLQVRESFSEKHWHSAVGKRPDWIRFLTGPAYRVIEDIRTFLSVLTLGGGVLVLRPPSLLRDRPWPGMGTTALAVGGVAVAFNLAVTAFEVWSNPVAFAFNGLRGVTYRFEYNTIGAILGAWCVLLIAGPWRTGPDWLERLGLCLSFGWAGICVFNLLSQIIWI